MVNFSTNGEFRLPYRPPWPGTWDNPPQCAPTPWNHARAGEANVPLYQNVTRVADPNHPTGSVPPYRRYDPDNNHYLNFDVNCNVPGVCGGWFVLGDLGGLPTQAVHPGSDDILACLSGQAPVGHNCYAQSGAGDFRICHKVGFKNLYARKQWHGTLGIMGQDAPYIYDGVTFDAVSGGFTLTRHWDPNNTYTKTKYRTVTVDFTNTEQSVLIYLDGTVSTAPPLEFYLKGATSTIDRYSGVETRSGGGGQSDPAYNFPALPALLTGSAQNLMEYFAKFNTQPSPQGYFTQDSSGFKLWDWSDYAQDFVVMESVSVTPGGGGRQKYHFGYDGPSGKPNVYQLQYEESASWNDQGASYNMGSIYYVQSGADYYGKHISTVTASVGYSDAYSANDCYQDALTALKAWDLSDDKVYPWRTDGYLAAAPMCCYDERPARSPLLITSPVELQMNDYTQPGVNGPYPYYDLTFSKTDWRDDAAYVWFYQGQYFSLGGTPPLVSVDDGNGNTYGTWPGHAELRPKQAAYTGKIITHNPAGYPPHFWFGFAQYQTRDPGAAQQTWVIATYGADITTTEPASAMLPAAALRWKQPYDSQYNGFVGQSGSAPGHYRGNWVRQDDSKVEMGFYQEAKEIWKGCNFARPCGADKFAVDQTTVCYVQTHAMNASNSALLASLDVYKTGNAVEPNAVGGLHVGDLIVVPSGPAPGLYPITAIAGQPALTVENDTHNVWRLYLGAKVDDLPTGYTGGLVGNDGIDSGYGLGEGWYVGRARFYTAPGLQGAQAVASYAPDPSGNYSAIAFAAPQPYLRSGESVDLLDAQHNVLATATVTRVDDVSFTVPYGALSGVAYAIAHGKKFYWNDDMVVHRDYVTMAWNFDLRTPNNPDPHFVQPPWYAGAYGCIGVTVNQPRAPFSSCYPAVITPPGLPGQITGDAIYGALWLGEVAQTMTDPLWQMPFRRDGELVSPDTLTVFVDDGSGQLDKNEEDLLYDTKLFTRFVPHPPLVVAMAFMPGTHGVPGAGMASDEVPPALAPGIHFEYDPAALLQPPADYPFGITDAHGDGQWVSLPGLWTFYLNASRNPGRFAADYDQFVRKDPKI